MSRRLTQAQCDRLRRLCALHTIVEVATITGISRHTISEVKRRGFAVGQTGRRPRPSTFAIEADRMTIAQLARHFRTGEKTVRRWADEIARPNMPSRRRYSARPIPDDLAAVVAEHGPYGAAEHYGVSYGTVRRWRKARGLAFSWSRQPGARRDAPRGPPRPAPTPPSMTGWVDRFRTATATERRA